MTEYAYMVVDHSATEKAVYLDGYNKLYIRCPPAALDGYRLSQTAQRKSSGKVWVPSSDGDAGHEVEIPLYRRDMMPAGWPEPWVRGVA